MNKTVLVVDDEMHIREMVEAYLSQEGFYILMAANGREALEVARQHKPDLILLDIMMPEMNGLDFLRAYQREADTPILMLTAKIEEHDRVLGLELGADDYIVKPFSMRELTARVRAVLRRLDKTAVTENKLTVGDIMLDIDARQATIKDQTIDLTPNEFSLLHALMSVPGRAYSRLELLDHAQGQAFEGYERNIDVHIRRLRRKIEPDPANPQYIETVYGFGYRLSTGN